MCANHAWALLDGNFFASLADQTAALFINGMEEGTLLQVGVGTVEGQVQPAAQGAEDHAVAAVVHEQGLLQCDLQKKYYTIAVKGRTSLA